MPLYQNWAVTGRRPDIISEPEEATILTVNADTLSKQITEIYRAWGMAEDVIEITVRNMVEADLRGIVRMALGCCRRTICAAKTAS